MNALIFDPIINDLNDKYSDRIIITGINPTDDLLNCQVNHSAYDLIHYLKNEWGYQFLTDLCGMHFPQKNDFPFSVVYHLHNWQTNLRIRIHCLLDEIAKTHSVTPIFASANWQERETYDFFGILFEGHPDMRRILNMDEMESFPLHKVFAMEDGGRMDKDDRYFGRTESNPI